MKIAYRILELDRSANAKSIREKLHFLNEIQSLICDARNEYPECLLKYPKFDHIFKSLTNVGFIGLWVSTLNAFYSFLDTDYDAILILEDDIILHDYFEKYFYEILAELPQEFGLFSFGYRKVYYSHFDDYNHSIQNKKIICKLFQSGDSWGICYSRNFIIELLEAIKTNKILHGLSDTAILSYALGNVHPITKYESYSILPKIGSLLYHDNDITKSSISNSKIV